MGGNRDMRHLKKFRLFESYIDEADNLAADAKSILTTHVTAPDLYASDKTSWVKFVQFDPKDNPRMVSDEIMEMYRDVFFKRQYSQCAYDTFVYRLDNFLKSEYKSYNVYKFSEEFNISIDLALLCFLSLNPYLKSEVIEKYFKIGWEEIEI